jgi:hypothetical protein
MANLHTINCTNEVSLQLLQTLRDDYMVIPVIFNTIFFLFLIRKSFR